MTPLLRRTAPLIAVALTLTGCSQATLRDVPMPSLVSGKTYEVTAEFRNVLGLPEQAPVKMDGDGFRPGAATPPFGSETRALLKEAGFDEAAIDALVAAKVTRTGF